MGSRASFGTPFASHSFNNGFNRGSGFNRGFGRDRGFDRDFRFDRGFGCCGFGFGFGFGFGWGWGWGGWWNPWWGPWGFWGPGWGWDPYWYGGAWGYPYYPPAVDYNYDRSVPGYGGDSGSNNSSSNYPGPYENAPEYQGSPNTNPDTGNLAVATPTVLLYLKDGSTFAASDYWVADGKLHYYVNYSGESSIDINDLDLQRTVDENSKRGVRFTLKPTPNRTDAVPATGSGAQANTGTASSSPEMNQQNKDNNSQPAAAPAPVPQQQTSSASHT